MDKLVAGMVDQRGLRETLLRLHGMAHAVINGAGLTVATDRESLPELAADGAAELREVILGVVVLSVSFGALQRETSLR